MPNQLPPPLPNVGPLPPPPPPKPVPKERTTGSGNRYGPSQARREQRLIVKAREAQRVAEWKAHHVQTAAALEVAVAESEALNAISTNAQHLQQQFELTVQQQLQQKQAEVHQLTLQHQQQLQDLATQHQHVVQKYQHELSQQQNKVIQQQQQIQELQRNQELLQGQVKLGIDKLEAGLADDFDMRRCKSAYCPT